MAEQLLHLVFGGEIADPQSKELVDLDALDIVGLFPNYATAHEAWQAKARATIDDAHTRYFIVHIHRLMDPDEDHAENAG